LIVGAAFVLDARRTVVDRLILRKEHLLVVTRGPMGRTTRAVPWPDLRSVLLESEERGSRSRDALMLRWQGEPELVWVRVGLGRESDELCWMRDLLQHLHGLLTTDQRVDEAVVGVVPEDRASADKAVGDS
ncbi:MAG: hypothetical protein AB8H79_02745, partial [Myxococcota bacterium]